MVRRLTAGYLRELPTAQAQELAPANGPGPAAPRKHLAYAAGPAR